MKVKGGIPCIKIVEVFLCNLDRSLYCDHGCNQMKSFATRTIIDKFVL
jgi:hypothetical protein